MVALATVADKALVPSLLEAPPNDSSASGKSGLPAPAANYSVDTLRRLRQSLKKIDQIFFLIGIDAFRDVAKWHQSEAIFPLCEFIVASRPGYSLADVANSLRKNSSRRTHHPAVQAASPGDLVLKGATVLVLERRPSGYLRNRDPRSRAPETSRQFVDPTVADYIKKTELYKTAP